MTPTWDSTRNYDPGSIVRTLVLPAAGGGRVWVGVTAVGDWRVGYADPFAGRDGRPNQRSGAGFLRPDGSAAELIRSGCPAAVLADALAEDADAGRVLGLTDLHGYRTGFVAFVGHVGRDLGFAPVPPLPAA